MYMKKYKLAVGCVMPYSNAPEIVDGAALGDNTTLKFLKIAGNISTDLLNQVKIYGSNYSK
ncbi:hypothetical protein [Nostoc sp.]|uniref:hypothetical protein n=1 Tax=Nostoc sp. TaxID=1180 RepID=UPI002FF5E6BD